MVLDGMFCIHMLGRYFNYSLQIAVSLLMLCLDDLSIVEGGVLKSPTVIVLQLISPFS